MSNIEVYNLKLFMIMLGSKPAGRHTEQHDIFFGIASSLKELVPNIKRFWPEGGAKIHIDAWREVTKVDDYKLNVSLRTETDSLSLRKPLRLFFINFGGYQENVFAEKHFNLLSVNEDKASALKAAKEALFFRFNLFWAEASHIDDKYGIDVDDIDEVEDILSDEQRGKYKIDLIRATDFTEDEIHLGYLKLNLTA